MSDHAPTNEQHRGQRLQLPRMRSAWQTLWTGAAAAALASGAGWALQTLFGAGH